MVDENPNEPGIVVADDNRCHHGHIPNSTTVAAIEESRLISTFLHPVRDAETALPVQRAEADDPIKTTQ